MDIQFLGATQIVTGSCFLIQVAGRQLLVDCGLFQGPREVEDRNREPFGFDPRQLDAVILTHAHLDHSGRLPLLVKAGYRGPVYTHRASRDLCRILLKDAAYLNERETEWVNRKRERKGLPLEAPLYTVPEAISAMAHFHGLDYGVAKTLFPGVKLRLQDAGHILGSSIVELWLTENGLTRKLVFSGDLGHRDAPILHDPTPIAEADLVIMESTYGDRLHRPWRETWQEVGEVFTQCRQDKGNVLIPAFAVGRTQEILFAFNKYYEDWGIGQWQVFLDSPLGIEATQIYARHHDLYDRESAKLRRDGLQQHQGELFELPNLRYTKTTLQSMALNRIQSGAVIIAGSGMCTGGRIKHHFKHNLWRRNCHVLIVGFQAAGTLGRALVDGAREVSLWGESIKVGARIHTVGGFSAHADYQGLLAWYEQFTSRPPLVLVHGEAQAMDSLQSRLRDTLQATVIQATDRSVMDLQSLRYQVRSPRPTLR